MGAKPVRQPPLLPEAAIVTEGYVVCPGEFVTIREYNLYGSDQWIEARTFSIDRDGKLVVILYMAFPHVDAEASFSQIIAIPEGEAPREMSFGELTATYPSVCDLVKPRA